MKRSPLQMVLFKDGTSAMMLVYAYEGACMAGDPTACVYRDNQLVWVKRGESVDWMEA